MIDRIGVTATSNLLSDEAALLQHSDQRTTLACIALIDRIDTLIRPP
jgi:hypothetical protein